MEMARLEKNASGKWKHTSKVSFGVLIFFVALQSVYQGAGRLHPFSPKSRYQPPTSEVFWGSTGTAGASDVRTLIAQPKETEETEEKEQQNNCEQKTQKTTSRDIYDQIREVSGDSNSTAMAAGALECPPPLVYFRDKVVRPSITPNITYNNGTRLIPQILHVSMKSRCLPRDLAMYMDHWKEQFPNYSIFFHDDDAVQRLLQEDWPEFPDIHRAMHCVKYKGAMVVDVWRVLILYKYGGVYSDIDNWPLEPFTEAVIEPTISAFFLSDAYNRPSQWFMAAEPRHPMMYMAMNIILHNLMQLANIAQPKVVFVTGPHAFRNGYVQFLMTPNNIENKVEIFAEGLQLGYYGKTIRKVSKNESENFMISKYKYDEVVPYNATLNMTRYDRIKRESGTIHWTKDIYFNKKKGEMLKNNLSCKAYLENLDRDAALLAAIPTQVEPAKLPASNLNETDDNDGVGDDENKPVETVASSTGRALTVSGGD